MESEEEIDWDAYDKQVAEEFAKEYCDHVDKMFVENLAKLEDGVNINVANLLQSCIDETSRIYGFKVDE